MRIKHTPNEIFRVYYYLPCKSELFKNVKRWYPYKHFFTKQGAINSIKRYKQSGKYRAHEVIFKIVWSPSPYASESEDIIVYNEDDI